MLLLMNYDMVCVGTHESPSPRSYRISYFDCDWRFYIRDSGLYVRLHSKLFSQSYHIAARLMNDDVRAFYVFPIKIILLIATHYWAHTVPLYLTPINRMNSKFEWIRMKYKIRIWMCTTYVDRDASDGEQFHCWIFLWQITIEFPTSFVPFHRVECIIFQIVRTY